MTPEELIARLRKSLLEEETSDDEVLAYAQIVPPFAEIKEFYHACFDNQLACRLLDEKDQPDPNNPLFCIRRERDIQAEQQPLLDWLEQTLKDGSVPQVILTSQQVFPLFRSAPEFALQPLVDLASALRTAVLGISHFSKGTAGRDPVERVTGSLAFGALARVVLCAVKVKGTDGDEDRRILARAKSNIGPDGGGFEYSIEQTQLEGYPDIEASVIQWGRQLEGSARDLLAEAETEDDEDEPARDVDAFIRGCLADGPRTAGQMKKDCDGAGYAWRTVQRAATRRLGIVPMKDGMRGGWVWSLPADAKAPRRQDATEGAEGDKHERLASSAPSGAGSGIFE